MTVRRADTARADRRLHLAVALHWVSSDWSDSAVKSVAGALDALGVLVATLWARTAVTPVKDARAEDGTPLVPITRVIAEQPGAEPPQDPDQPAAGVPPTPYRPEHAAGA